MVAEPVRLSGGPNASTRAALEHLLATDRTAKQNAQLFHLIAVCPRCREVGGWLLELHQAKALPPVFGLIAEDKRPDPVNAPEWHERSELTFSEAR